MSSSITKLAPAPSLFFLFLFFIILSLISSSFSSLSFNFPTITNEQYNNINLTGDASITTQGIQVTKNERIGNLTGSVGRAIYHEPLHLWDNFSNKLADFSTHFTFVMNSEGNQTYADGLAFFLAPASVRSSILNVTAGGGLGLAEQNQTANSSLEAFVAVEFDTFNNDWDPRYNSTPTHVGIDVNSVVSVATKKWDTDISGGQKNEAWITYDASSRNLTVTFTNYKSSIAHQRGISYLVNLREFLPEYVVFGFSAATGIYYQTNNVKSWDFNSSNLGPDVENNTAAQPPPSMGPGPGTDHGKGNTTGLIVGLSVGLPLIILASAFAGCFIWKRKHKKGLEEVELTNMDNEFGKGMGPKKFSYKELLCATSNFSEKENLGEGGFGGVYRGWLTKMGSYVAVKRVSQGSKQGLKEYVSEVKIISQLRLETSKFGATYGTVPRKM